MKICVLNKTHCIGRFVLGMRHTVCEDLCSEWHTLYVNFCVRSEAYCMWAFVLRISHIVCEPMTHIEWKHLCSEWDILYIKVWLTRAYKLVDILPVWNEPHYMWALVTKWDILYMKFRLACTCKVVNIVPVLWKFGMTRIVYEHLLAMRMQGCW
jgi:hypothetical protein